MLPLSAQLKLSRTSFYWFFEDREQLLDQLLERWRSNSDKFIDQATAFAGTIAEATLNIVSCLIDPAILDSPFETAVRSWAQGSEKVKALTAEEDARRLDAIASVFLRFGFDPVSADARSRAIYLTQMGYIWMRTAEPMDVRMARIPSYVELFCGSAPSRAELDRFHARHGFVSLGSES